jgi:hypothetical protein
VVNASQIKVGQTLSLAFLGGESLLCNQIATKTGSPLNHGGKAGLLFTPLGYVLGL